MAAYKLAPTDKGIRQGIADLKAAKAAATTTPLPPTQPPSSGAEVDQYRPLSSTGAPVASTPAPDVLTPRQVARAKREATVRAELADREATDAEDNEWKMVAKELDERDERDVPV